ncbi:MAG: hypothetical protein V3U74_06445 [Thermodesulfobacteriota bacterium]
MSFKTAVGILVLIVVLIVGLKTVPIMYKGYIALPGTCKGAVDLYKKYGATYVQTEMNDRLDTLNVPREKREIYVRVSGSKVYGTIIYFDTADFYGKYQKDFYFQEECEGERSSVYDRGR